MHCVGVENLPSFGSAAASAARRLETGNASDNLYLVHEALPVYDAVREIDLHHLT